MPPPEEPVDYADLVTRIYTKYQPDKLEDPTFVQSTLKRYEGREQELIEKLEAKYGPPPPAPAAAAAEEQPVVDYAVVVARYYEKHQPEKLEDPNFVASTLKRFEGREQELLQKLEAKYGSVDDLDREEGEEMPAGAGADSADAGVSKAEQEKETREENSAAEQIQRIQRGRNARKSAAKEREMLTNMVLSGGYDDYTGTEVTEQMQAEFADQYDVQKGMTKLEDEKDHLLTALQSSNFGAVDKRGLKKQMGGRVNTWVKQYDPAEKRNFWVHSKTNQKVYTQPEDYVEDTDQQEEVETAQAALKVQSMFRGHQSRVEIATKVEMHRAKLQNLWVEQFDPQTKQMYYFNTETGSVQKEQPPEFVPGGSDERLTAVLKLQCNWRAKKARKDAVEAKKAREAAELDYFAPDVLVAAFGVEKARQRRKYVAFNRLQRDKLQSQREALILAVDRLEAMEALRPDLDAATDPQRGMGIAGAGASGGGGGSGNNDADADDADGAAADAPVVSDRDQLPVLSMDVIDSLEALAAEYAESKGDSVQLATMSTGVVSFEDVEAQLVQLGAKLPGLAAALELACANFVDADGWRLKKAAADMGMPKLELIHGLPVVRAAGEEFASRTMPLFERLRRCCDFATHQISKAEGELQGVRDAEYAGVVDTFFDWHMACQEAVSAVDEAVAVSKGIQAAVHRERERQQEARERKYMFAQEREQKMVDRILRIRKLQQTQRTRFVEVCQDAWARGQILKRQDADDKVVAAQELEEATKAKEQAIHEQAERERSIRDKHQTSAWQAVKDGCSVATLQRLIIDERRRRKNQEGLLLSNGRGRGRRGGGDEGGEGEDRAEGFKNMSGHDFHIDDHDHKTGEVLLRNAVWFGQPELVAALIAMGADVNKIDNMISRATSLHEGARAGHAEIVELLVKAGAKMEVRDGSGDTPLHVACRNGWTAVVKVLLAAAVGPQEEEEGSGMTGMWQSVIAKNNKGWKAIQLTRKAGILKLLLRCEEMLPEKMEEERIKQAEMQERMEARRSKNLSVIKRTKGDGGGGGLTGSTGAAAEQERLALEEDEAAVAAVGRKKKGKRRKKKAQEGVEFSQEWGSASAF